MHMHAIHLPLYHRTKTVSTYPEQQGNKVTYRRKPSRDFAPAAVCRTVHANNDNGRRKP